MSRIGLFGGTFDPVHRGHIKIAKTAMEKADLDSVIFIPSGNPPHKTEQKVTDKWDRFEMVKIATEPYDCFSVSDYELNRKERSYSLNLIKHFKNIYKNDELYFIMGSDSLYNLPTWWHYEELMEICNFIVISRPVQYEKERLLEKFQGSEKPFRAFFIDGVNIDISATEIRDALKMGQDISSFVEDDVLQYIKDNSLYI